MRNSFYFPLLFLRPKFEANLAIGKYGISKRKWSTSTFDLATLATRHDLHLPYQVIEVMLGQCNLELEIRELSSHKEAVGWLDSFRVGAYLAGCSPFIAPFMTSESINDYSGINERDSALERGREPKIPSPLSSSSGNVSAWPLDLSFTCITNANAMDITEEQFTNAVRTAESWHTLSKETDSVRALTDAFLASPSLPTHAQSLLHIWTAIESLFPSVNTEVSFRVGMYLTVLCSEPKDRSEFYRKVRAAYGLRSKVAHGALNDVSVDQWDQAWMLLCGCAKSISRRGSVPKESELLDELFNGSHNA